MGARYRTQSVGDVEVYYREAGPPDASIILLLHGFPTPGYMFRDLIPRLAGRYRVIAPDLPGFCRVSLSPKVICESQYFNGADASRVLPDGYTLDIADMARPGADDAFQAFFREWRPPYLAAWGKRDAHFIPAGALAFKRDLPKAEVDLLDAGHLLETNDEEIGRLILDVLGREV